MFDKLDELLAAAKKEVSDVTTAQGELDAAKGAFSQAQAAADAAQSVVNEKRTVMLGQKNEALVALQAVQAELAAQIQALDAAG
jgi:hypothetical protein